MDSIVHAIAGVGNRVVNHHYSRSFSALICIVCARYSLARCNTIKK